MSGRKRHPGKQQATGRAKGCQDSKMSRANQIKRKLHHQAWISRERNVEAERVLRTHGVNGRDNRPVRRRSYRLSLFFTSVTRLARDLLVFYMYTVYCILYIHIYIYILYLHTVYDCIRIVWCFLWGYYQRKQKQEFGDFQQLSEFVCNHSRNTRLTDLISISKSI